MRSGIIISSVLIALSSAATEVTHEVSPPSKGLASWYGEAHRGKLMANGRKFDPSKLTAASWFYPLGSKVRVASQSPRKVKRTVIVTITDRGPARDLVESGRVIDLTYGAFKRLRNPDSGLVPVVVERIR
jgi:rare lipoprotein A